VQQPPQTQIVLAEITCALRPDIISPLKGKDKRLVVQTDTPEAPLHQQGHENTLHQLQIREERSVYIFRADPVLPQTGAPSEGRK